MAGSRKRLDRDQRKRPGPGPEPRDWSWQILVCYAGPGFISATVLK
jgi:hypothetical protein